ncbi:MAG TPA: pseudouridine synthase family protein [Candidatus Azoamicus sp. MARI]
MILNIKFFTKDLILLLNKPIFFTSNQVIQLIKKYSLLDKIGHAGTLDPSASGILIICTNLETKLLNIFIKYNKRYLVFSLVGLDSNTLDVFGQIKYFTFDYLSIKKNIVKFFLSSIKKMSKQKPPIYSSIKHNGHNLYKYSRLELNIKIKEHPVEIYNICLVKLIGNMIILDIECSKGTYIREIINTLSLKLKLPIAVYKIIRLKCSKHSILDSFNFF